jgi:DNA repair photolyase
MIEVTPTVRITEKPCSTALTRSRIPGMEACINPYTGCEHACAYCYASFMKRFTGISEPWGSFVLAKTNAPDRLSHELRRDCPRRVMLSSVTDPYQPAEERFRLTRRCLERLAPTDADVSILTKSDLVLRDLDILKRMHQVEVGFTVTTADDDTARILEPGAPPSSRRFRALAALSAAGIPTWVFIAPLIPGIADTEEALAAIVSRAAAAGSQRVAYDPLNCYPTAVANLRGIFARHWPGRLPAFESACRDPDGFREACRRLAERVWPRCGYRPP